MFDINDSDDFLHRPHRHPRADEDGYFWIMGRIDDVLNVSGHRLGTMEVESALVQSGRPDWVSKMPSQFSSPKNDNHHPTHFMWSTPHFYP